jgi:hypothetical protein
VEALTCGTERPEREGTLGLLTWAEGGCWPAGKREKKGKREVGRVGKEPAQEERGRDGLRVRGEGKRDGLLGWADFFSVISFSFLFQTNSILFEFK